MKPSEDLDMSKERKWAGTTYGNSWMHRWLIRILQYVNTRVLYAFVAIFVVPVCLLVNPGRKVIYHYFRDIWHLSPLMSFLKTYKNFCLFGQTVIDKFAMYAGKKFQIEEEGEALFTELASQPEGFLLLSAHIGNYEIAGYTMVNKQKKLNALFWGGEKASIMMNREKMFKDTNIHMISIRNDMSHLFEINAALSQGEIVSMPADRFIGSSKSVVLPFLGTEAHFPLGPFVVAVSRSLKVLAVNVMKTSSNKYKITMVPLTYDPQASKQEQEMQLARNYVHELERMLTLFPEQWYNYYDFWHHGTD